MKYCRMRKVPNALPNAGMISEPRLSDRPRSFTMTNTGMMIVCSGTIIVARKMPKTMFFAGNRTMANA